MIFFYFKVEMPIKTENHTIIYSGGDAHEHGVGIAMTDRVARSLMGYWPVNERIIMCKLRAKPFNIVVLQVYAPTSDYSDEEIEDFYEEINKTLKETKSSDMVLIMGDFNAKVGDLVMSKSIGKYGLGKTNDRGETLIQFCERNDMSIANTLFKQPKRRLYTWKSPGDVHRNQIDYLLIKSRFKNSIINCRTYPGADIKSDHSPVVMKMKLKLKIPKRPSCKTLKFNLSALKEDELKAKYAVNVQNRYECLINVEEEGPETSQKVLEKQWRCLKEAITVTNEEMLPKKTAEAKQPWMKPEILEMMLERKSKKGTEQYNLIDDEIKKECIKAKEEFYNNKCEKVERLAMENNLAPMYREIKSFNKKGNATAGCIKNKDGNILFETEAIVNRWTEYVEELFDDKRGDNPIRSFLKGPSILKSEVEKGLKCMSTGKACGIDNISTEMLIALGDFGTTVLTELTNKMYETAHIPDDLKTSVFILLPKKPKALECSDFRTISLMCHVLKLLLTIILHRMSEKINNEVGEEQAGFRKNSGTREAIFNLKIAAEKYLEVHKEIYACFIDYSKAFDTVNHEKLAEILTRIGVDENDIAVITSLYWEQKTCIKFDAELSKPVQIKRGVRQGCVMSPSLFNVYTDFIFREIEELPGLNIGGKNTNNLRYADDTVLLAENEKDLQELVTKVKDESNLYGLQMNKKKTQTMVISRSEEIPKVKILIDGTCLEQVRNFKYLGQQISEDGRSEQEIKRRIGIAKSTFEQMNKLLTNRKTFL
jgi:exonuclease III